ncbi:MAG: S8 family serine peptidase, partial [Wenzhouxiangellaceae bacterium]|nr:S8 family serine peptidase [Wenzhouxiangellaceae bacterium]
MNRIRLLVFSALALCGTVWGQAFADAVIGPELDRRMQAGECPCEVIVTFNNRSGLAKLDALALEPLKLNVLPMAGLVAGNAEIDLIAGLAGVESIYFNAPLEYYNFNSGEITDGHLAHDTLPYTGAGVTVAVLDSGIDANHPDLAFGSKTVQNVKIVGDLGLLGGTTLFAEGVSNSDTTSGHGTHVAGTVAGTGVISADDPRRPYANDGIAPGASLVGLGAGEGLSILYALIGFDYAIANQDRLGIDVITNSWGCCDGAEFDPNDPINKASFEAYRRGMVVLFAASNSGPAENTINKYATPPWVISVAAGTPDAALADFSSRGVAGHRYKHPDIMAPGDGITSTRAPGTAVGALGPVTDPIEYYPYYHTISGTSMATPFVAGTTALLLEANPQLSPDQVLEILMATAEPVEGRAFHEVGAGHVNVLDALLLAEDTAGERVHFLEGQTRWSANGDWNRIDDADSRLQLVGNWRARNDDGALEGSVSWI